MLIERALLQCIGLYPRVPTLATAGLKFKWKLALANCKYIFFVNIYIYIYIIVYRPNPKRITALENSTVVTIVNS